MDLKTKPRASIYQTVSNLVVGRVYKVSYAVWSNGPVEGEENGWSNGMLNVFQGQWPNEGKYFKAKESEHLEWSTVVIVTVIFMIWLLF